MKQIVRLKVNGDLYELAVNPWQTLNEVLREELNLTGTKKGCGDGDCGACTVLIDGLAVVSCLTLAVEAEEHDIVTVEGLAATRETLHPIQWSFIQEGAIQCGYCTPGMELAALHLLKKNPNPTEAEVRAGLSGNLCRCTGYDKIVSAVRAAAIKLRTPGTVPQD